MPRADRPPAVRQTVTPPGRNVGKGKGVCLNNPLRTRIRTRACPPHKSTRVVTHTPTHTRILTPRTHTPLLPPPSRPPPHALLTPLSRPSPPSPYFVELHFKIGHGRRQQGQVRRHRNHLRRLPHPRFAHVHDRLALAVEYTVQCENTTEYGIRYQVSSLRSQVSGLRSQVSGLRSQVSARR